MKIQDFKIYIKFLSRNKLYTLVSVLGFSISLMFVILLSIYVKQEWSVDSFHEKKDRIYLMTHDNDVNFANPVAPFVKEKCPEVEDFVRLYRHYQPTYVGEKGKEKTLTKVLFADSGFFNVFTFGLIEGDPAHVLTAPKSVVITQGFAHKIFGDVNPVGSTLILDNVEHNVMGIMEDIPQNSQIPQCDIVVNYNSIIPYHGTDEILTRDYNFGFTIYFLAKEGTDLPAKTEMLLGLFKENFWFYKDGFTSDLKFIPVEDVYFTVNGHQYSLIRTNSKTLTMVYTIIAILILIVALLNYINMTVAQSGFRGKEVAIKKLLGSKRSRIISQLLYESLLMAIVAFAIGLFLAFVCEPFFDEMLNTKLQLAQQITASTIAFSTLLILIIAFLAGIIPALLISNFNPLEVVKGSLAKKIKSSYSKVLIIFQYTVAIALLICSSLIRQQSDFLVNYDAGYNRDRIIVMNNKLEKSQMEGFKSKLLGIPGVELVSFSHGTPLNGGNNMSFEVDGQQLSFQEFAIDSAFLKIYNIKIEPNGVAPTKDTYWVNKLGYNALNPDSVTFIANMGWVGNKQIAGIVSDFNFRSLHEPMGFVRMKMDPDYWIMDISVKIADGVDLYTTAKLVEDTYSDYLGGEAIEVEFIDKTIQEWYTKEKNTSSILTTFTLLTILITIMGVFAMSLYLVRQKEKEIGIRKVNGATDLEILIMLNKDSLLRVLIAFVIACPIAYYAVSKWLESFPYKISIDWLAFLIAGLVIVVLTLVSVSWMTWRSAHANPVESLKGD